MVVVLVVLTFAVVLVVEWMSTHGTVRATRKPAGAFATEPGAGATRYYHAGHTWAAFAQDGTAFVGVDEFARSLVGPACEVELPKPGSRVRQGEALFAFANGGRRLVQPAPISGTVVRASAPAAGRDWLAVVLPADRRGEMSSLLRGVQADRWQEMAWSRLSGLFGPQLGPVMQDGGERLECVSDLLSDAQWQQIVDEMFPVQGPGQGTF